MPRGIIVTMAQCTDPAREEEFNRWYSHTHIPDLSRAKGFVRARRFRNTRPDARYKYQVLYEFDWSDLEEAQDDFLLQAYRAYKGGRHIDCIGTSARDVEPPAQSGLWEEIDPAEFKPLERLAYSTTALPGTFNRIEARLRAKGKL